ncbi:MAG: spore cortex biosynthesis protein YabQ [Tuberibacillus sp.]
MTLPEQFATMIAMTAIGVWIGAGLTTYHRFLHTRKKWQWLMILTDILFWMVQGLLVFLVLLHVNEGEIRFYIFLALALGFSAYKALFEAFYKKGLEAFILVIRTAFRIITRTFSLFLIQPTIVLLKVFYRLGKMISRILLTVLLFLFTAVIFPLKWLYKLVIPKRWRESAFAFWGKSKTFVGKWFKKWK